MRSLGHQIQLKVDVYINGEPGDVQFVL